MDARERRQLGAHYTSERDIARLLGPLFLDELQERLAVALADRSGRGAGLREYVGGLRRLRMLDPACGGGDVLIAAYRELRRLELRALVAMEAVGERDDSGRVDLGQVYGIEIDASSAQAAECGLLRVDEQCELEWAQAGLRGRASGAPNLRVVNALQFDWSELLPAGDDVLVLGNPPFVGKHYQTPAQKADMAAVFAAFGNAGDLDYVACWFVAAARYVQGTRARCAFVATNSVTQGEQVPLLWRVLFAAFGVKIHFAHRTFKWSSEAPGAAHVHVVIIGFAGFDRGGKRIYEYAGDAAVCVDGVANISPYLTRGPDRYVVKARAVLTAGVPEMRCGNKPSDGGHLIFTDAERGEFLRAEPGAEPLFRRYCGSEEFIHGGVRWCLWLRGADPAVLRGLPGVVERVERVRGFRRSSTAAPTRAAAERAAEFFYVSQPAGEYIAVPEVSSERRGYIPVGFLAPEVIASNKLYVVAAPDMFLFGVLSSAMHMAWVRVVGGRLRIDYQYSATMVYNTFPWPAGADVAERGAVEAAARGVLAARGGGRTLAELYDPLGMPARLAGAHAELDRAVDRCYRREGFGSEAVRFEHALGRYQELVAVRAHVCGCRRNSPSR